MGWLPPGKMLQQNAISRFHDSTHTSAPGNLLEQIFKPIYIEHATPLSKQLALSSYH